MTRFRWWLERNEISYFRAANALEWALPAVIALAENRVFPSDEEMEAIKEYTFDEVCHKHWFKADFEKEQRRIKRKNKIRWIEPQN